MGMIQYTLTDRCRKRLLRTFPPRFANVKCDHITLKFGVPRPAALSPLPKKLFVVGYATDGKGVECLVVEADKSTRVRGGRNTLHVTLSIADGRRSVESNDVLAGGKWRRLKRKIPLQAKVEYVEQTS